MTSLCVCQTPTAARNGTSINNTKGKRGNFRDCQDSFFFYSMTILVHLHTSGADSLTRSTRQTENLPAFGAWRVLDSDPGPRCGNIDWEWTLLWPYETQIIVQSRVFFKCHISLLYIVNFCVKHAIKSRWTTKFVLILFFLCLPETYSHTDMKTFWTIAKRETRAWFSFCTGLHWNDQNKPRFVHFSRLSADT